MYLSIPINHENEHKNMMVLERFPNIKKLFFKFNTPLISSAPVERLFSFATILNSSRRFLSDDNFENAVLLRSNWGKVKLIKNI